MEDLLQNIIKDAAGKQNQNLKQAAQIAYGKSSRKINELFMCDKPKISSDYFFYAHTTSTYRQAL